MNSQVQSHVQKMSLVTLLAFVAIALSLVYWSTVRSNTILRREDNPRLVEAEFRLQRGQIVDRQGIVLAQSIGSPERLLRDYPVPVAGPVVGYYSLRYGTAGIEEGLDALLRGEPEALQESAMRRLLNRPQVGHNLRLTLDAQLQQTAAALLSGSHGAIVLLTLSSTATEAEITALVSLPGYDPNTLDERFDELVADDDGPLLNRATQGQYQPGLLLQPLILAAALDRELVELEDIPVGPAGQDGWNTDTCSEQPPPASNWRDILRSRCAEPMQQLADRLGAAGLDQVFTMAGLTAAPALPINTDIPESEPVSDALLAGIGQDTLAVTPLQLSILLGALANDGRLPQLRLVTDVQAAGAAWRPLPRVEVEALEAFSPASARAIRLALPRHDQDGLSVAEHRITVLSGPEGTTNSWYLGLAPALNPTHVAVVVVEDELELEPATVIGRRLLDEVRDAD